MSNVKWRARDGTYCATIHGLRCRVTLGCGVWLWSVMLPSGIMDGPATAFRVFYDETNCQKQCERWVNALAKRMGVK